MVTSAAYTENGFIHAVIDEQEFIVPDDMANRYRVLISGWEYDGNTIAPYVPKPVEPIPVRSVLVASAMFTITGGMLSEIDTNSGLAMAFPIGVGQYWLFFPEPQDDKSFSVYPSSSSGQVNVTMRELDFIELTVTENGQAIDPSEFSVQVVRMR